MMNVESRESEQVGRPARGATFYGRGGKGE